MKKINLYYIIFQMIGIYSIYSAATTAAERKLISDSGSGGKHKPLSEQERKELEYHFKNQQSTQNTVDENKKLNDSLLKFKELENEYVARLNGIDHSIRKFQDLKKTTEDMLLEIENLRKHNPLYQNFIALKAYLDWQKKRLENLATILTKEIKQTESAEYKKFNTLMQELITQQQNLSRELATHKGINQTHIYSKHIKERYAEIIDLLTKLHQLNFELFANTEEAKKLKADIEKSLIETKEARNKYTTSDITEFKSKESVDTRLNVDPEETTLLNNLTQSMKTTDAIKDHIEKQKGKINNLQAKASKYVSLNEDDQEMLEFYTTDVKEKNNIYKMGISDIINRAQELVNHYKNKVKNPPNEAQESIKNKQKIYTEIAEKYKNDLAKIRVEEEKKSKKPSMWDDVKGWF